MTSTAKELKYHLIKKHEITEPEYLKDLLEDARITDIKRVQKLRALKTSQK